MKDTIRDILAKIETLNNDLREEYDRLASKYGFSFDRNRVRFLEAFQKKHSAYRAPLFWRRISLMNIREVIAVPFILGMIVPTLLLDLCITIYQACAFPLYGIPRVKRGDYITYERRFLKYLNIQHKLQCLYCSYVNGLFAYAVEIAGRTERYWCPIKAAHKPQFAHGWYKEFADYGNPEEWNEKFSAGQQAFTDAYGDPYLMKK